MLRHALLLLSLAATLPCPLTAQQRDLGDVIGSILGRSPDTVRHLATLETRATILLPSISANPTAGLLLGVSGNSVIRHGRDSTTNLSALNLSANYSTKGQFSAILRSNIFTTGNRFKFEGDWRYLSATQSTWGLGRYPADSLESPMYFQMFRFSQSVLREVSENLLFGMGYHLSVYADIVDRLAAPGVTTPFLAYNGGATVTSTVGFVSVPARRPPTRAEPSGRQNSGRSLLSAANCGRLPSS